MDKSNCKPTMTDALRAAIQQSGLTLYRIGRDSGVPASCVVRFMAGETSLRLDRADRLAAYLGLHLVPDPDAVPPEPTPANLARPMLAKKTQPKRRRSDRR